MIEEKPTYWVELPAGTEHVVFKDLPHLLALARWPHDGNAEDLNARDWSYGVARKNFQDELRVAVDRGLLQVSDPLVDGPHPFPVGDSLQQSVVLLPGLRKWLKKRGGTIGVRLRKNLHGTVEDLVAWFDDALEADHWFSMSNIEPANAALLLCEYNPNERDALTIASAIFTDETSPQDFLRLRQRFEDLNISSPRMRTLSDWVRAAGEMDLNYHSWVDSYIAQSGIAQRQPERNTMYGIWEDEKPDVPATVETALVTAMSKSASPAPLTTGDIAFVFEGLRWKTQAEWKKPLGDKPKWLERCIEVRGQRGVRETLWNPVSIAAALVKAGHVKPHHARARFQTRLLLKPWLEKWKTYEADHIDNQ